MTRSNVKVTNDNVIGNYAQVLVNDVMIPCYRITVEMKPGVLNRVIIETDANLVDIEALESKTEVKIIKPPTRDDDTTS